MSDRSETKPPADEGRLDRRVRPPPLQGGLTNAELLTAWMQKLPRVEPSERDLSAFALGVEVGRELGLQAAAQAAQPDDSYQDEWFKAKAVAVLRAVQADLSAYHKSDDDRISVAMARIQMWRDGKPGARLYSRPEVDAMLASELERIAHEPPVSGNEIAQARVLLAAAQLRGA